MGGGERAKRVDRIEGGKSIDQTDGQRRERLTGDGWSMSSQTGWSATAGALRRVQRAAMRAEGGEGVRISGRAQVSTALRNAHAPAQTLRLGFHGESEAKNRKPQAKQTSERNKQAYLHLLLFYRRNIAIFEDGEDEKRRRRRSGVRREERASRRSAPKQIYVQIHIDGPTPACRPASRLRWAVAAGIRGEWAEEVRMDKGLISNCIAVMERWI